MNNRGLARMAVPLAFMALIAACDRETAEAPAGSGSAATTLPPAVSAADTVQPACAPGSATLGRTGLCQAQATALLQRPGGRTAAPDGCDWTTNEAAMPGGGALLYRALRCGSRTATLRFAPGADASRVELVTSPFEGAPDEAEPIAQMHRATDAGGIRTLARAAVDDPAERRRCEVRPAAVEDWPMDALVVDEVPEPPADGIRSACGPLGYDGGAQTFWRVSQGTAWFFSLGQDSPPVDAASFTLVTRNAQGRWVRA